MRNYPVWMFVAAALLGATSLAGAEPKDLLAPSSPRAALATKQQPVDVLRKALDALRQSGRQPERYRLFELLITSKTEGVFWELRFLPKGEYIPVDSLVTVRVTDGTGEASVRGALGAK